jgi:hypothetical protein
MEIAKLPPSPSCEPAANAVRTENFAVGAARNIARF